MFIEQKEFLASQAEKLIPFQTSRLNFGHASSTAISDELSDQTSQTRNLDVILPVTASSVVILMQVSPDPNSFETDIIEQVRVAPPGVSRITVTIPDQQEYWIYIVSKELEDGFVSAEGGIISENELESSRQRFSLDSPNPAHTEIRPAVSIETPSNTQTWYNYEGSYTGPLIWENQAIFSEGDALELLTRKSFVENALSIFSQSFSDIRDDYEDLAERPPNFNIVPDSLMAIDARDKISLLWEDLNRRAEDNRVKNVLAQFEQLIDSRYLERIQNIEPVDNPLRESLANHLARVFVTYRFSGYRFSSYSPRTGNFNNSEWWWDVRREIIQDENENRKFPRMFQQDSEAYGQIHGWLSGFDPERDTAPPTRERANRVLAQILQNQISEVQGVLNNQYTFLGVNNDTDEWNEALVEEFETSVKNHAQAWFLDAFQYLLDLKFELDAEIEERGDAVLTGEVDTTATPLAQEAILQNIRFLRSLVTNLGSDVWTHATTHNSLIHNAIESLSEELTTSQAGSQSVLGLGSATVDATSIEVMYTDNIKNKDWKSLNGRLYESGQGVLYLDVSFLNDVGKYVFLVRPRKHRISVQPSGVEIPGTIKTPDLNDFQTENYFYGWNIEFETETSDRTKIGNQKMVVGSVFQSADNQILRVSPFPKGGFDFTETSIAYIWNNDFIPLMFEVSVVPHNNETLSYALYSKKEFNTESGRLVIYDAQGNPYKEFTVGRRALVNEDRDIIEFRDPIE